MLTERIDTSRMTLIGLLAGKIILSLLLFWSHCPQIALPFPPPAIFPVFRSSLTALSVTSCSVKVCSVSWSRSCSQPTPLARTVQRPTFQITYVHLILWCRMSSSKKKRFVDLKFVSFLLLLLLFSSNSAAHRYCATFGPSHISFVLIPYISLIQVDILEPKDEEPVKEPKSINKNKAEAPTA